MAMRRTTRERPAPSGAWIVWMAGLVMGAGAGMLFIYHMLLASHAVSTRPLVTPAAPPPVAAAAPATAKPSALNAEHDAALREAMKPANR